MEVTMRHKSNYWHLKTTMAGEKFLRSSHWDCHYIIAINDTNYTIYDTRKYGDMQDFNYYGYSVVSHHINLKTAKQKVNRLYRLNR